MVRATSSDVEYIQAGIVFIYAPDTILCSFFQYSFRKILHFIKYLSGYNTYRGWTQTGYLNKHYNINQKDEDT